MLDTPMGREKKMSATTRIEHLSDHLSALAIHLFNGACIAALCLMIYGGHTGLAGDAFVSFSRDYTVNAAVLAFALMFLVALRGAMLVVYLAIVVIVAMVQRIRGARLTAR